MKVRRPKTQTKRCAHCARRRLAKFIEWHPGIEEWQCSNFDNCDTAIAKKERKAVATPTPPKLRKCAACGHVAVPKRVHFEATDLDGDVCPKCESECCERTNSPKSSITMKPRSKADL